MDDDTPVRTELVRQQDETRVTIYRGVTLIALAPLVVAGAVIASIAVGTIGATVLAMLLASLYVLVGGIAGIALIASGIVERGRVRKQLRDLDSPRCLPEARLIVR